MTRPETTTLDPREPWPFPEILEPKTEAELQREFLATVEEAVW